ncbi:MAG: MCE family protein [Sphingomonadales bacterium]|nr:MCE family protein [Sphingomonadales bacterium]
MQNSNSDRFKIGKQEVRLGLFAALAIGLLIFGFNFLKGENVFNSNLTYYVRYPNALNLQSSSPVLFRGVKVGSVREVILQPEGVLIEFYAREDIQIPVGSEARVISTDLFNTRAIEILFSTNLEVTNSYDTLVGTVETALLEKIADQVTPMRNRIDSLLQTTQRLLGAIDPDELNRTVGNVEIATAQLAEMSSSLKDPLNQSITNMQSVSRNLAKNNEQINNIIKNAGKLSDSLSVLSLQPTLTSLNQNLASLSAILQKIERGDGTMGKMVQDSSLYHRLDESARSLNLLMEDFRKQPRRYLNFSVFGGKIKEPKK